MYVCMYVCMYVYTVCAESTIVDVGLSACDGAILDSSPFRDPKTLSPCFTAGGERMGKPDWAKNAKAWGVMEPPSVAMRSTAPQPVVPSQRRDAPPSGHRERSLEEKAGYRKDPDDDDKRKKRRRPSRERSPEFPWLRLTDDGTEFFCRGLECQARDCGPH